MSHPSLFYSDPVYRPPSEGKNSLLLTATIGCSYRCSFCYPYRNKKFAIRSVADIKKDIDTAKSLYRNVSRIFLLDGNAFVLQPEHLVEVSKYCYQQHPNLTRVSAYAHAKDILRKTDSELAQIKDAGLTMVYVGIETGDDTLLQQINKRTTADELAEAAQKLHRAGIIFSGTLILGLAGKDPRLSEQHAIASAHLVNRMNPPSIQPWYISALTLMTPPGTPIEKAVRTGEFIPLDSVGILTELKIFMEHLSEDLHDCIFRSNHASNYLPLKGILAKDRSRLIATITHGLNDPSRLRSENFRGL